MKPTYANAQQKEKKEKEKERKNEARKAKKEGGEKAKRCPLNRGSLWRKI